MKTAMQRIQVDTSNAFKPSKIEAENLTVRVSSHFKARAKIACDYMGTSLTEVVHAALSQVIDKYQKQFQSDKQFAVYQFRGLVAERCLMVLEDYVKNANQDIEKLVIREEVKRFLLDKAGLVDG